VEPHAETESTPEAESAAGSTLATWCSWMEVSMPGLKNAGLEVA